MLTFSFPSNSEQLKPSEEPMYTGRVITWVLRDENGNEIDSSTGGLVPEPTEQSLSQKLKISEDAAIKIDTARMFMGQNKDTTPSQIVKSASEPPDDQIPVVDMPQKAPDIPGQDDRTTIADAEPPQDTPDQPDDKSPIPTTPEQQPDDTPETTEEKPSDGEQEQPHHEHDIYTYYQADIMSGNETTESITITVNIATREVYGNHYFEGYIGGGYRTSTYEFDTYLDSSGSFVTTSTAKVHQDGQYLDDYTVKITGELADDMSYIVGDIIDETVGYGVTYYAELISQSEEQPETEDY